jgi:hypothetical protein
MAMPLPEQLAHDWVVCSTSQLHLPAGTHLALQVRSGGIHVDAVSIGAVDGGALPVGRARAAGKADRRTAKACACEE